jgi:DNA phosphorothioation-associated DGQHR protein 1
MINFPYKVPVVQINQPIGVFYAGTLHSSLLLEVCYSKPAQVIAASEGFSGYSVSGGQRIQKPERFKDIAKYIDTTEATFPNSIILSANINEDGLIEDDENKRWRIEKSDVDGVFFLVIPTREKLASIIDGQHRVFAFEQSVINNDMQLLCSIFFDLGFPYQSYIFSTINSNQVKVDRSLAYEFFGFSLENEPPDSWSPEKLAVYIGRLLNTNDDSPLHKHIEIGLQDASEVFGVNGWGISMATIVDGIVRLISSNPKQDREEMHKFKLFEGRNRSKLKSKDGLPFRKLYVEGNDLAIYKIIENYFMAADKVYWSKSGDRSYIKKTVGIQALFDILKILLNQLIENTPEFDKRILNVDYFVNKLGPASYIDYSDDFFQASGKGRGRIKNCIGVCANLFAVEDLRISSEERALYENVLRRYL